MSEIRWYKGKYKVEVVLKSKGNWRVKALEWITLKSVNGQVKAFRGRAEEFTTVPRLLWRHPRK